jgi:hypothetical protein
VPLAGVLGLFHFGVVPEVKPFQPTTRIIRLDMGWVAIVLSCDVVKAWLKALLAVHTKGLLVTGYAPSRRSLPEPS